MSVSVENLSVAYRSRRGDVTAVDNVSFSLADGEIMGLAGESGSGKSTLGNALIYLDARMKATGGKVTVDGKELPIADNKRHAAEADDRGLARPAVRDERAHPDQEDRQADRRPAQVARRAATATRSYAELKRRLELIGLKEDVLSKYSFELSGGMRQRVTIIMSTLLEPVAAHRRRGHLGARRVHPARGGEMLLEFRDRGYIKSAIAITHDLSILAQIADSIAIMYAGRLAERAPTRHDRGQPAAPVHPGAARLAARGRRAARPGRR